MCRFIRLFTISNHVFRSSKIFSEFVDSLSANVRARAFEAGIYSSLDMCNEFGYDREAKLCSGIISYSDIPVIQPLSCTCRLYIYCLRCALDPRYSCEYKDILGGILYGRLPTSNYLSGHCPELLLIRKL